MSKSTYKILYSDIKSQPITHLPLYWNVDFRSFDRAMKQARRLHKQGRDIVILESDSLGLIASWEMIVDRELVVFNFNETRTDLT